MRKRPPAPPPRTFGLNTDQPLVSRTRYVEQDGSRVPKPELFTKKPFDHAKAAAEKAAKAEARASGARSAKPNSRDRKEAKPEAEKRFRDNNGARDERSDADKKARKEKRSGKPEKHIHEPNANTINEAAPRVFSAQFALGATKLSEIPKDELPHIAFFGRSNVGKSSILSALMGKKGLVKISAAPGKTREINFFLVNNAFYFVDLPGIGYAKVSIGMRDKMADMIREYVEQCPNLRGIVYLVDMRHAGTPLDIETVETLRGLGKPVLLVANKRDKINQGQASKASQEIQERFGLEEPPLAVSALTKFGFEPLWTSLLEAIATEPA